MCHTSFEFNRLVKNFWFHKRSLLTSPDAREKPFAKSFGKAAGKTIAKMPKPIASKTSKKSPNRKKFQLGPIKLQSTNS
jgi:hypothetical protein